MQMTFSAPQIDMAWMDAGQYFTGQSIDQHKQSSPDLNSPKKENNCDKKSRETIALIDFLNIVRIEIADTPDAKFQTIDEFIATIKLIAQKIHAMDNFKQIYLVTKSFKFNDEISYIKMIPIILWAFGTAVPNWQDKIRLVLVNGINDKDREADDRALFYLSSEYSKTMNRDVIIFSNDNFSSLKSHFFREIVLNFYTIKNIGETWQDSEISYHKENKKICKQQRLVNKKSFHIVHPSNNRRSLITISQ